MTLHRIVVFLPFLLLTILNSGGFPTESCSIPQEEPFASQREEMVRSQLAERGIKDPEVLRAMRTVPRHFFVPLEEIRNAYRDDPLPIGHGQTISQPYIVAYMTEIIQPHKGQKVLEVGTGSGYQAAVLAEIVDSVFTIEIVAPLAAEAEKRLRTLHYTNVIVRCGDGYAGWPEHAPFDAIIVTAAPDHIPPPLMDQLKEGGRMIIPTGEAWSVQELTLVEKNNGRISAHTVAPVRFVPLVREKEGPP